MEVIFPLYYHSPPAYDSPRFNSRCLHEHFISKLFNHHFPSHYPWLQCLQNYRQGNIQVITTK